MEENTDNQMETDVSSTTQDISPVQVSTGPTSSMEITVEVAETTGEDEEEFRKEDQDGRIDSNTPETKPPETGESESIVNKVGMENNSVEVSTVKENQNETETNIETNGEPMQLHVVTVTDTNSEPSHSKSKIESEIQKSPEKSMISIESVKSPKKKVYTNPQEHSPQKVIQNMTEASPEPQSPMTTISNNEGLEKDEVVVAIPVELISEKSLDSQPDITLPTDIQEKEHNKSISRELKSLIESAKESKIISECTQLKTKTRKSRTAYDISNSSFNTSSEAEKIKASRRDSSNSQKSNSSEKSEKNNLKRSMRSQNPEFASKHKQFLNAVTGKVHKDENEVPSSVADNESSSQDSKRSLQSNSTGVSPKKKKVESKCAKTSNKLRSDSYCWRCHWVIEPMSTEKNHLPANCTVCPRSFHYKCLSVSERSKLASESNWVCPKCITILNAESSETRSPLMKKVTLGMLCELLKYALQRMMEVNGVEPFMNPVDRNVFPDYDKYVVHAVHLNQMQENINAGVYGSTEAFLSDAQWILHNSIIFNTLHSKLTAVARALLRSCRCEMSEIEACPECYAGAHARRPTWFTDVCSTPHILLWAKLKGFPYWPAKGMSVNNGGMVDVRFFGAHDRAWVPARDCYLYSEKDPNNFRTKRQDIIDSMQEAEQHIRNISRKFGKFVYPTYKVQFEANKMNEQLKIMIPGYEADQTPSPKIKEKPSNSSSPFKERPASKSCKDSFVDDLKSDDEESAKDKEPIPKRKMADGAEIAPEDKSDKANESITTMEVDQPTKKEKEISRKRRRSALEEAVITVMSPSGSTKKKKPVSTEMKAIDNNKSDQPTDTTNVPTEPTNKPEETETAQKPETTKENRESPVTTSPRPVTRTSTPISIYKNTPKSSTAKEIDKSTPKASDSSKTSKETEKTKTPKAAVREKSSSSDKSSQEEKIKPRRDRTSKSHQSLLKSDITSKKNVTNETNKEKTDSEKSTPEKITSTPKNKTAKTPKDNQTIIIDEDDTSLAVLAKKGNDNYLPTITSVRSLSQTEIPNKTKKTTENTTVETENSNAQDAAAKLQKLRNDSDQSLVGRVGVKAFARMPSPSTEKKKNKDSDRVEVEVKAEPIDFDDADRQSEKIDLMNTIKLRPVNQALTNLRDVRINKVTVSKPMAVKKPIVVNAADVRPKARKTFPQPQKTNELNSKNSMVYIPIQPPMTQAPHRPPVRTSVNGPTQTTQVIRHPMPAATTTANNIVNTVTTPLMTVVSLPSSLPTVTPSMPALSAISGISSVPQLANAGTGSAVGTVPTLGQLATLGQVSSLGPVPTIGQVPTSVHTLPLITSVNGQWTLSLQPMMSVGVDRPASPPLMNGEALRALPQPSPGTPTPSTPRAEAQNTPGELPRLQQKPALLNPLDPDTPAGEVPVPSAAGPLTAKLNQNAVKLADFFRNLLEDSLVSIDHPAAQVTSLKLQMEQQKWRHKQEIEELKHNNELVKLEMRSSFDNEMTRVVSETRKACQAEMTAAVNHAKSKQWCANCQQEAQFYCCWNTSYCDLACQRVHWNKHFAVCTQQRQDKNPESDKSTVDLTEERLQPPENPPVLQKPAITVGGKTTVTRVISKNPTHNKSSIIVSMVEDSSGNQTVKCVGTYKANNPKQVPPLVINKQIMNDENAAKKIVTSGGYLIVGTTPTTSNSVALN